MAIEIKSGASTDALTIGATNKAARTELYDSTGTAIARKRNDPYGDDQYGLPIGGSDDGGFRRIRVDRTGGVATAKYRPNVTYNLYTAALPPAWLAPATTFTITHALATGTLLNAAATGAVSSHASLISMKSLYKMQSAPIFSRHRARLIKGAANGQADWGISSSQAPAATILANGFVFLYGADGTLKPTVYQNSAVIAQGADFAGLITANPSKYYVWDVILVGDDVTFVCHDASAGLIINEQTLKVNDLGPRFGQSAFWFQHARSFVTSAAANVGLATQLHIADSDMGTLDVDEGKPWQDVIAGMGFGTVVNPTVALTQLANWANTAAPASATLSNTAAGYTTLGGQFQFAAVAGAETDYALFAFTVPAGVSLHVDSIRIETTNTGAAVATTETMLHWFMGDALAATLATNSFRRALGVQAFPIAAAIGAVASPIDRQFRTPFVVHSGRIFHIGLKMPRGTATASQVIRGLVDVGGYFE